jgi:transcriptional accessory protein Tex/SPT6
VAHRDQNGPFATRRELLKVARLGPKAFEQAAGFLRITGGKEPLDASSVHPEAYDVARKIVAACGRDIRSLMGDGAALKKGEPARFRRRPLRPADGEGHPGRTGKARPRPAPQLQDRDLHRRRARRSRT